MSVGVSRSNFQYPKVDQRWSALGRVVVHRWVQMTHGGSCGMIAERTGEIVAFSFERLECR
jgi:hypothetical protein